ncbi:hypothetical protein [Pigmentiphaga litoralis]|uniref:hypothetical protein n=1 Tax=Pigmentiphaga litoralis TaxID=516702 RepID=UPI003B432488
MVPFSSRVRHAASSLNVLKIAGAVVLLAGATAFTQQARAQAFPSHPIRMVVAYAPGGATDIVGRMLAQEMSADLGQTVVLENRAGAARWSVPTRCGGHRLTAIRCCLAPTLS